MRDARVLTVSDSAAQGRREDLSGPAARKILEDAGYRVAGVDIVADERGEIEEWLRRVSDADRPAVVVTTGGTGLSVRDVTPEATLAVAEKLVPGMSELMRQEGIRKTPKAALSRGVTVIRGTTLIINLPGSVRGVRESLEAVLPILAHAVEVLQEGSAHCGE